MDESVITIAVRTVEFIAVLMILAAVVLAAWKLGMGLLQRSGKAMATGIRLQLGQHLVLALEFLIAADILKTVLAPTLEDLAFLGGIILIRTVLSISIAYELRRERSDVFASNRHRLNQRSSPSWTRFRIDRWPSQSIYCFRRSVAFAPDCW